MLYNLNAHALKRKNGIEKNKKGVKCFLSIRHFGFHYLFSQIALLTKHNPKSFNLPFKLAHVIPSNNDTMYHSALDIPFRMH